MGNWDEVSIKTEFMKDMLSKIVNKALKKKINYDVKVQVNELNIEDKDNKLHAHLSIDAEMTMEELEKILKSVV